MRITAEIIAASIAPNGQRIWTFELEYPRIVHSELMTHREFSRNSASSRAVPVEKMNTMITEEPAMPIFFGKNQRGMVDAGEHHELIQGYTPQEWWQMAIQSAVYYSDGFRKAGYHKQIGNRLTEAGQHMKVVMTTSSLDNWFWLRLDGGADPTIRALAIAMNAAVEETEPRPLLPGEWHVPYYFDGFWSERENGKDIHGHTLEEALMISASCCAQVSYRTLDQTLEKAEDLFNRLVKSEPVHASPFEHQASPMEWSRWDLLPEGEAWEDGVTHVDRDGIFWSGNFRGWVQHRQLIPNHVRGDHKFQF